MSARTLLGILACAVVAPAAPISGLAAPSPFRVLAVAGTSGDHSPMSTAGKPVLEKLAAASGFTLEYTTDKGALNAANLEKFQVLLQLNLYPFDLNAAQQSALRAFVEAGKGWVGIHAAGCAQASWPWFMDLMGGVTWSRHAELRTGTLLFEDRTHPATAGMPASLSIKDEWYQFSKSPRARVHVLAKADEAVYSRDPADKDHPLVWTQPDFAKAMYIGIGHDPGDWSVPAYVSLVRDALLWAGPAATGIAVRGTDRPDRRPRLEFKDGILRIGTGCETADARGRPAPLADQ